VVDLFSSSSVPLRVIILSPPGSGKPGSGGIGSWNDKSVLVFFFVVLFIHFSSTRTANTFLDLVCR
jgi:hypothetical protein